MYRKKILIVLISISYQLSSQIGIGTTTPEQTAILEVNSTDKGLLPPRLTNEQRNLVLNPAKGLTIFNNTTNCLEFWNGSGWYNVCDNTTVLPPSYCDNDISVGTGNLVKMLYDYNGDGVAEYNWCAREISIDTDGDGTDDQIWLDRNLGAYKRADDHRDNYADNNSYIIAQASSFGDLYQWGRPMDGHQKRGQRTGLLAEEGGAAQNTALHGNLDPPALATTDTPGFSDFILDDFSAGNNNDWRDDNNTNRWITTPQGPCPSNFHVPSQTEMNNLRTLIDNGSNSTIVDAHDVLALPTSGSRRSTDGAITDVADLGFFWTNTRTAGGGSNGYLMGYFDINLILDYNNARANSVRCIKD